MLYQNATHTTQNATLVLRDIVATPLPQCSLVGIRSTSASAWRDSLVATPEARSPVGPEPRHFRRSRKRDRVFTKHRDPIDGIPVMAAMVAADSRRRGGLQDLYLPVVYPAGMANTHHVAQEISDHIHRWLPSRRPPITASFRVDRPTSPESLYKPEDDTGVNVVEFPHLVVEYLGMFL